MLFSDPMYELEARGRLIEICHDWLDERFRDLREFRYVPEDDKTCRCKWVLDGIRDRASGRGGGRGDMSADVPKTFEPITDGWMLTRQFTGRKNYVGGWAVWGEELRMRVNEYLDEIDCTSDEDEYKELVKWGDFV